MRTFRVEHWVRQLSIIGEIGSQLPLHRHDWGQLVWAERGGVSVRADRGDGLLLPARALWVPIQQAHALGFQQRTLLRFLYFAPALCRQMPTQSRVVKLTPLLRQLLHTAFERTPLGSCALVDLLVQELAANASESVELPMPLDGRARLLAQCLQDRQQLHVPLATLLKKIGASRRTLERLFLAETGLGIAAWRQRVRMSVAAQQLADGVSISAVTDALGYASESAFAAAFRARLGVSPAKFAGLVQRNLCD